LWKKRKASPWRKTPSSRTSALYRKRPRKKRTNRCKFPRKKRKSPRLRRAPTGPIGKVLRKNRFSSQYGWRKTKWSPRRSRSPMNPRSRRPRRRKKSNQNLWRKTRKKRSPSRWRRR